MNVERELDYTQMVGKTTTSRIHTISETHLNDKRFFFNSRDTHTHTSARWPYRSIYFLFPKRVRRKFM